ncbi:MAG: serpin family protein [Cytophagaceae bacterium]|nr:serpin family protein [Gemmatimonadaceae bacterium]
MVHHSRRLTGAMLLALTAACSDPTANDKQPSPITALPRQLSSAEQAIAQSTPDFAIGLLRAVNPAFADRNVFTSPLSASMALGMTLNGAAGTTFSEMRSALGLPDRPVAELNAGYQALIALLRGLDPTVDFRIANSIWYEQTFGQFIEPAFLTATRTAFGAEVAGLNFRSPQAVGTINAWVNTGTNGKITSIVDEIPDEMVMYLVNATYFKGAWRDAFDPKKTASASFTTHTGAQVSAPTMTRKGGFRAGTVAGTTVVELPYGGDAFVMTIAMPAQGTHINAFVAGLTPATWASFTSGTTAATFDLYLPKFKLTWDSMLNDALKSMGMRQAFVEGGADFTALSRTKGTELFVSEVRQKTFVDVNEEGTEAAAVTSVGVGITSLPPTFRIDRPFVFAIREKLTGTVLFLGKIVNPTA